MDKFKVNDIIYWKDWRQAIFSRANPRQAPYLMRIVAVDNRFYYQEGVDSSSNGFTEKRYCEERSDKISELKRILLYDEKKKTEKEKKDFISVLQRSAKSVEDVTK